MESEALQHLRIAGCGTGLLKKARQRLEEFMRCAARSPALHYSRSASSAMRA